MTFMSTDSNGTCSNIAQQPSLAHACSTPFLFISATPLPELGSLPTDGLDSTSQKKDSALFSVHRKKMDSLPAYAIPYQPLAQPSCPHSHQIPAT